jgi:hypothetical protein
MNELLKKYHSEVMNEVQTELSYPTAIEYMRTCSSKLTSFEDIIQSMNGRPGELIKAIKGHLNKARKWRDSHPTALNSTVPVTLATLLNKVYFDLECSIILKAKNDGHTIQELKQ